MNLYAVALAPLPPMTVLARCGHAIEERMGGFTEWIQGS